MRTSVAAPLIVCTILMGGCTWVGAPGAPNASEPGPAPPVSSAPTAVFGGSVTLGKQRIPLVLELRGVRSGREEATLRIPAVPMEATGRGRWSGDRLRLTLRYGDACPGTVQLDASITDGRGQGTLSAHDCTGGESGPVTLVRRVADDHTDAAARAARATTPDGRGGTGFSVTLPVRDTSLVPGS